MRISSRKVQGRRRVLVELILPFPAKRKKA
jgi:hypothetical protein